MQAQASHSHGLMNHWVKRHYYRPKSVKEIIKTCQYCRLKGFTLY